MTNRGFLGFCVTVVAILGIAAAASGLPGDAKQFSSTVTIHPPNGGDSTYAYGLVGSPKAACARNREVQVEQDLQGAPVDYQPFGPVTHTNQDGTWSSSGGGVFVNGHYRAVALKKSTSAGTCRLTRSQPIFYD
jgi:hypothetical protein